MDLGDTDVAGSHRPRRGGGDGGLESGPLSGRPHPAQDVHDFAIARRRMIEEQLLDRGIRDPAVLRAMGEVQRHRFVDPSFWGRAYGDHALPTVEGQTISQPYIVARMLELAELQPEHRVL